MLFLRWRLRQRQQPYEIVIIQHACVIDDGAGLFIHRQRSITLTGAFFGDDFFKDAFFRSCVIMFQKNGTNV
jgi:hypothetical protein